MYMPVDISGLRT